MSDHNERDGIAILSHSQHTGFDDSSIPTISSIPTTSSIPTIGTIPTLSPFNTDGAEEDSSIGYESSSDYSFGDLSFLSEADTACPEPGDMPCEPTLCGNRDELANSLTTWVEDAERALHNHISGVGRWSEKQQRLCEARVAVTAARIKQNESAIRRLIRKLEQSNKNLEESITEERGRTNDKIYNAERTLEDWISSKRGEIECARNMIAGIARNAGRIIPNELLCPITKELMSDPVVASDGHTYEKEAIMRVLRDQHVPRSPITNLPLENATIFPNLNLRSLCRNWQNRIP